MIAWLGQLVAGPIVNGLIDAYKAKLEAGNDRDRIAAELAGRELAVEQRERELRAQLLVAEQGRWYTAIIRPAFALVVFVLFAKVIIWDTVLGWGVTPALKGTVAEWAGVIVTTYFGGRTVEKVARIFRR